MSNFPTAFWKKQPAEEAVGVGTTIAWETGLSWSYDTTDEAVGVTSPFPIKGTTSFPFVVDIDGYGEEEYYSSYGTATTTINKGTDPSQFADQVFYAWYLTGGYDTAGENDTSTIHSPNPWEVGELSARIDFEADYITASWSGIEPSYDIWTKYNQFIQSGSATGSFTLGSTSNLTISVSGLGQDKNRTYQWADAYDTMTLHLYNGSTEELICSGEAPEDNRNLLAEEVGWYHNFDMQQVKLYSGSDLENIVNYQGRHGGTVDEDYGAVRSNTTQWVDQNDRISYVNSNGTGMFTKNNLVAGDYEIRIRASSIDGDLTSGAFYGFTFSFS